MNAYHGPASGLRYGYWVFNDGWQKLSWLPLCIAVRRKPLFLYLSIGVPGKGIRMWHNAASEGSWRWRVESWKR